jgi:hypothetical protein
MLDVRAQSALGFRAESAHQKDNQADQQNQAKATATDGRPANIKTAAAEQEKKNNDKKEYIHDCKIALRGNGSYGALPYLLGDVVVAEARDQRPAVRDQQKPGPLILLREPRMTANFSADGADDRGFGSEF